MLTTLLKKLKADNQLWGSIKIDAFAPGRRGFLTSLMQGVQVILKSTIKRNNYANTTTH